MARIPLSAGFTLIPEGTYVFKVTKVKYKEDFGKMEVTLTTADGQMHIERFSLLKNDGDVNQGAMNAFSYFARACLGDATADEIDEQDLIGCYIRCEVTHEQVESTKKPGSFVTYARLGDKIHAEGYDNEAPSTEEKKPGSKFNLDSLLG